jgi:RHS repeat-associated protein
MTTEYLHADKLGNVVAVTSPTAAADAKYYYDPFGRRINATDQIVSVGTPDVQLGFGAQEMDDDLELVNMHGRIYDPYERRFMSVDPHVTNPKNALSYNPYTYVLNSPVNGTDPTGFDADSESDGADPGASWGWTDYFNGSSGTYSDNAFPVGTSPPATPDGASAGYTPATDVESDMSVWEIENDPYGFEETTAPQVPAAGPARHVVGADEAATNAAFLNILARNGSIYYQNIIPGTIHYNEATDSYLGTPRTTGVIEMGDPWNYKPNLVVDLDYPRSTEVDPDPSEFQIWARRADMGGGAVQKLSDFGWDNLTYGHEWVYHPASGAEAGMGPVPGTPGGFGGPTQMNDHRGAHGDASAILMTTVNVGDPQAVLNAMKVGTDTGRWYGPGMNDCHTAAETAVFGPPAPSMIGSYKFLLMP